MILYLMIQDFFLHEFQTSRNLINLFVTIEVTPDHHVTIADIFMDAIMDDINAMVSFIIIFKSGYQ